MVAIFEKVLLVFQGTGETRGGNLQGIRSQNEVLHIQTPADLLTDATAIINRDSTLLIDIEAKDPSPPFSSIFNLYQLHPFI
jgi:hypothetical protein